MKYTSETTIYNKDAIGDGIADAAKRADDFMEYKDGTLTVGKKNGDGWTGTRAAIDNDSFDILDENGNPIASYGATTTIGKSSGAHIDMNQDGVTVVDEGGIATQFAGGYLTLGGQDSSVSIEQTSISIAGPNKKSILWAMRTATGDILFGLDPDAKILFNQGLGEMDFVIEHGTDVNGWKYRNWQSGKAEAWRRINLTTSGMTTANGIPYAQYTGYALPRNMSAVTNMYATETGGYFFCITIGNITGSSHSINVARIASSSTAAVNIQIDLYAVGTWR